MKKSLVLAMAMALGVTASAYAANPFSDVPAGHWAYDSVNKLAAAGVIEGYPDGTYGGDKLMTRYEMAQIVAKAMARGANVDRLAAEFADELDSLGVRVAALEKKSDNVKITGQIRYEYRDNSGDTDLGNDRHRLQTRLFLNGQINEDWSYGARIQNRQDFTNNAGDDKTDLNRAYVDGKLGGVKVTAGRQGMLLADGNLYDDTMDAVKLSYGKEVKLTGYYAKPTESGIYADKKYEKAWGAQLSGKVGDFTLFGGYDKFDDFELAPVEDLMKNGVWHVGAKFAVKEVNVSAMYLKSDIDLADELDVDSDGFVVGLGFMGAKAAEPGTWGLYGKYYDQGTGTFVAHTMNAPLKDYAVEGFKGFQVGGEYTFAKNIVGMVEYYDLEGKESDASTRTIYSRLQFTF